MPRTLNITGSYPSDWKAISDQTWADAGHRCIRCGHPYRKGEHGKGEWTPCDSQCRHGGPIGIQFDDGTIVPTSPGLLVRTRKPTPTCFYVAQWRIGTVHHMDGNKSNCAWWNLLALCQRCHLTIQTKVNPDQPFMLEHSDWFKPYAAGFYAKKYEGRDLTRQQAVAEMDRLLAYEYLT